MTTPLQRLVSLAPPAVAPPPTDWSDAERRLGRPLPQDYKELVDTYGHGEFDEHIRLRVPEDTPASRDLIFMNDGYFEELEDIWEMNEEAPEEIAEEGTTLVVWARTKDADTLNWLVRPGQAANAWTVMVLNDALTEWEHYDMNGTAFLAGLLSGDIDSGILSCELTPPNHTFRAYPA